MLIKDRNDNYIWKPSLDIAKPDTILGHDIYTSSYMPGITGTVAQDGGKKVLLFGDFSYYWIADRQNRTLKRLNELYRAVRGDGSHRIHRHAACGWKAHPARGDAGHGPGHWCRGLRKVVTGHGACNA